MVVEGDTHLSKWIENTHRLDCDDFCRDVCERILKPGMVVVDGGACLGDHTMSYLNAVGESGRVLAFEPNPEAFACLKHNCPKAECFQWGLGEKDSELCLTPNENLGAAFLSDAEYGLRVHVVALDVFNLTQLDLLKLDVEGMELEALRGAKNTIQRCQPVILLELNDTTLNRRGAGSTELLEYLDELHYEVEKFYSLDDHKNPQMDLLFFKKK